MFDAGEDGRRALPGLRARRGRTLGAARAPTARCPTATCCAIGLALADALAHAHERGVDPPRRQAAERDRPRRARARAAGAAKLTDFGVAHLAGDEPLTRTGDVVGTLAYMAPEQAGGRARRRARRPLLARARALRGAGRASTRCGPARPAATARRVGTRAAAAARASASDLPAGAVRGARPRAAPEPGRARRRSTTSPTRSPTRCRRSPTRAARSRRTRSSATRCPCCRPRRRGSPAPRPPAALAAAALLGLTPEPAAPRAAAAARRRRSSRSLPRAGWLAAALRRRRARRSGPTRAPAPRCVVLVAVARRRRCCCARDGRAWSLPAAARRCSAWSALAGAYPALAGRAPRLVARARALGAAGAWWLLLAEPLLGRDAAARPGAGAARAARWDGAASIAAGDVLAAARQLRRARCSPLLWALAARRPAVARARPLRWPPTSSARPPGPPALARRDAPRVARRSRRRPRAARPGRPGALAGGRRSPWRRADAVILRARPEELDRRQVLRLAAHERAAQPRVQARRPRRGHVLACLQVRGAPGRDRAQARARDGASTRSSRCRAPTRPNEYAVWLSPEDREQFEGYEDELRARAVGLPARARPPRADRAA